MQITEEMQRSLLERAAQARQHAYVPYSHYAVGACLLCADGTMINGCNIENASYGGTICAERTALVKAVSEGQRDFLAIAVVGSGETIAYPCGQCRQFMSEFGLDVLVISANDGLSKIDVQPLSKLLPCSFGPQDLPG